MGVKVIATLLLLGTAAAIDGSGAERAPAPRPVGRPGERVEGHLLAVSTPNRLRFGHHLEMILTCRQPDTTPHLVRFDWAGPFQTVAVDLRTDRGEAVPVVAEVWPESNSSYELEYARVRLRPTGAHARGVYPTPGRYRLSVRVDARRDPFDPTRFLGRVEAAPVSFTVGPEEKLTPDGTRQLIAELSDPKPAVRSAAIARVPPTADEGLLAAVVERLADPHEGRGRWVQAPVLDFPGPTRPIAEAARYDVLPGQGTAAVGPLLAFAAKPGNAARRRDVIDVIGKLGYDTRSRTFLVDIASNGEHTERCDAVQALGRLGPEVVPVLVRIARDAGQNDIIRRLAIEETVRHGTAETVGPFLREALGFADAPHRSAAARAIGAVGERAALSDLKKRAMEEAEEQNVRCDSLKSYVLLADPKAAQELLRSLSGVKNEAVRTHAERWLNGLRGPGEP